MVSVVKVATMLEARTTEEQHSVLHFLWAKGLNGRISIKICFLFKVGSVCRIKLFTTGLRNSLEDARKSHIPNEVTLLTITTEPTLQRMEELTRADRRIMIDSVATALRCSHDLAYSIMHDCFEVSESVCIVGAQRTALGCSHGLAYSIMQD
jgi:hypothetical protein